MPTVKEVSEGLIAGKITFEQALDMLQGVLSTNTVVSQTPEEMIRSDALDDPPVGDDNDTDYLRLAGQLGAITPEQIEQLANVMS